ncbi:MBL fold metallo-hydrolase [Dokdonia sp. Hel_I_53]|uniref:MBL fold metallo-hydrolase n=1 Tax=Dokdonia sp. Hel_I_53 TaxID=1566287 RepID=UPI0011996C44|nr:MBL fold metallo-hydrolase [Dokdonia sp. Hel_I_53]TVZ51475.1 phosphoribosyl 1,2-cyclic phosphate phosphodiesterase [Dokdonia sp. Hel_I_53]
MKITFLGTGTSQGIPIIGSTHPVCLSDDPRDKRLRVSVLLEWDEYNYVIDCGPDFRKQMLNTLSRKRSKEGQAAILHGILFTHEHADHVAGLDDIRPFVFRQGDMPLYGHRRVLETLSSRFDYIFRTEDRYPGAPSVKSYEVVNGEPIRLGNLDVVPIEVYHGDLQVFGYRFDKIAYLTDVKTIANKEIEKLKDLDILVLNCLREEEHFTHLNLTEALALIKKINPKKAYLTHISHMLGFHAEVENKLPNDVFLAYDGLTLSL